MISPTVAMLRSLRSGTRAALRPTINKAVAAAVIRLLRTSPLFRSGAVKAFLRAEGPVSDRVQTARTRLTTMADFLVVLGIIAFAAAMLGLIWALDRV
jgi:hypothetical protein